MAATKLRQPSVFVASRLEALTKKGGASEEEQSEMPTSDVKKAPSRPPGSFLLPLGRNNSEIGWFRVSVPSARAGEGTTHGSLMVHYAIEVDAWMPPRRHRYTMDKVFRDFLDFYDELNEELQRAQANNATVPQEPSSMTSNGGSAKQPPLVRGGSSGSSSTSSALSASSVASPPRSLSSLLDANKRSKLNKRTMDMRRLELQKWLVKTLQNEDVLNSMALERFLKISQSTGIPPPTTPPAHHPANVTALPLPEPPQMSPSSSIEGLPPTVASPGPPNGLTAVRANGTQMDAMSRAHGEAADLANGVNGDAGAGVHTNGLNAGPPIAQQGGGADSESPIRANNVATGVHVEAGAVRVGKDGPDARADEHLPRVDARKGNGGSSLARGAPPAGAAPPRAAAAAPDGRLSLSLEDSSSLMSAGVFSSEMLLFNGLESGSSTGGGGGGEASVGIAGGAGEQEVSSCARGADWDSPNAPVAGRASSPSGVGGQGAAADESVGSVGESDEFHTPARPVNQGTRGRHAVADDSINSNSHASGPDDDTRQGDPPWQTASQVLAPLSAGPAPHEGASGRRDTLVGLLLSPHARVLGAGIRPFSLGISGSARREPRASQGDGDEAVDGRGDGSSSVSGDATGAGLYNAQGRGHWLAGPANHAGRVAKKGAAKKKSSPSRRLFGGDDGGKHALSSSTGSSPQPSNVGAGGSSHGKGLLSDGGSHVSGSPLSDASLPVQLSLMMSPRMSPEAMRETLGAAVLLQASLERAAHHDGAEASSGADLGGVAEVGEAGEVGERAASTPRGDDGGGDASLSLEESMESSGVEARGEEGAVKEAATEDESCPDENEVMCRVRAGNQVPEPSLSMDLPGGELPGEAHGGVGGGEESPAVPVATIAEISGDVTSSGPAAQVAREGEGTTTVEAEGEAVASEGDTTNAGPRVTPEGAQVALPEAEGAPGEVSMGEASTSQQDGRSNDDVMDGAWADVMASGGDRSSADAFPSGAGVEGGMVDNASVREGRPDLFDGALAVGSVPQVAGPADTTHLEGPSSAAVSAADDGTSELMGGSLATSSAASGLLSATKTAPCAMMGPKVDGEQGTGGGGGLIVGKGLRLARTWPAATLPSCRWLRTHGQLRLRGCQRIVLLPRSPCRPQRGAWRVSVARGACL
eukprot:jgi/Mesvir1/19302/Mv10372-RA.1